MKLLSDAGWWMRAVIHNQIDRAVAWYLRSMERYEDEFD